MLIQKVVMFLTAVAVAAGQQAPTSAPFPSSCTVKTKGMEKQAKELLRTWCELEKEEVRKKIRDLQKPDPAIAPAPLVPGSVGVAAANLAVTKVTFREQRGEDGFVLDGSKEGAKHVETMARISASVEKTKAKAARPASSGCGFLGLGCPTIVPVVYGDAYYGGGGYVTPYGGGGYNGGGWVQPYNNPGGYHRR